MTHLTILEGVFFFVAGVTICCAFVPEDKSLVMNGDLLLGGLFPIHSTLQGKKCLNMQGQDGIQALEAMKYSIKSVNEDSELLPGITLGMVGVDTCSSETVTLDNTLELIDMRINKNVGPETYACKSEVIMTNKLVGIIGPASSKLSIPVANLLRLFKIPQISYQSTSPELSDKTRFEYFKRTAPSDHFQVRVIADILKYMDYRYISVVYEDSSYGLNYKTGLERLSESGDFCIGTSLKLPYDQSDEQNKRIIETLLQHKNTNGNVVVVVILLPGPATSLFKSVNDMNEVKSFHWIGTDGWTGRSVSKEIKDVINGAIGVQLLFGKIPGFKEYFVSMHGKSNPWWDDYRETYKDRCTSNICDLDEFGILHYINDAVRAFAHALNGMYTTKRGNSTSICQELKTSLKREPALLESLGRVEFTDSQGGQFKFYNNSEGPPRYSIMRYHSTGKIEWEIIGNYSDYYATNRSCGGQHTTTYPHKRLAKLSHLSDIITKEDEDTNVYPLFKKVVDVQGADGNIYKGRMDRLEAKLPPVTQTTQDPSSMQRRDKSTQQPMRPKVMREVKPSSVKMLHSPSPPPKNGSRPPSPMPQETISVE